MALMPWFKTVKTQSKVYIFERKIKTFGGGNIMIKVGSKAPTFTAPAYYQGKFTKVDLADYAGKWVMLCFYPGDFTFV